MGDKDLEKMIAGISSQEKKAAIKQAQNDRLKELVEKQKKIIEEKDQIIQNQQQKIDSMFDVPADVEELKKIIGAQRADMKDKDSKLELAYSRVGELEQELQGTNRSQEILNKRFEETFSKIGEIKAAMAEKTAMISMKDSTIGSLNIKVQEFQKIIDENQKQLMDLQGQLRAKELQLIDEKGKIEAELKQEAYAQKDEALKRVRELEKQLLDKELTSKEGISSAQDSIKAYNEMKEKYEKLIAQYDENRAKAKEVEDYKLSLDEEINSLREFKNENTPIISIFKKLQTLMAKEPYYQIFTIIWDVGEIPIEDLKKAVGIPTVTIQKYVNDYINAGIFMETESGKLALVDRPKKA